MEAQSPEIEETMRHYNSLNEKDRRRYAGLEVLRHGHGGREYIAGVLGCSRNTVSKEAVRVNAAAFLLSHCHPSGSPEPSPDDVALNEKILQVGQLLEIPMLDHIVVGQDAWVSMKDRGLGF